MLGLKLVSLLLLCLLSVTSLSATRKLPAMEGKSSRRDQMINFFAGGMAGTVSSCLTIPLEVVKTQLQSSTIGKANAIGICKRIWQQDGAKGFFRGLQPLLVGIIPTRAVYFWAYSTTKARLAETAIGESSLNHLLSAFTAGIVSNTMSNPLWMVRTRFQLLADKSVGQQAYSSYGEVVRSIWKAEGVKGFYKGLGASYLGCFEGAIHWMAYEKIKASIVRGKADARNPNPTPSAGEMFLAAAASKFTAICLTYPHEVARTRMREQATHGVFKYSGALQTLRTIAREEGARGLYSGLGMHLLRSVPNAAIMFVSYEIVGAWLKARPTGASTTDEVPSS